MTMVWWIPEEFWQATLAEDPTTSKAQAEEFLDRILESATELERIVELLVAVAADEAARLTLRSEPVEIRQMLDAVVDRWKDKVDGRHEISRRVARGLPTIIGDRRLLERSLDEPNAQPKAANDFGRGGIFGEFHAERLDSAAALQHLAAPKHGLSLRKTEAECIGEILPSRLIGVQKRAFELRPHVSSPGADRRRTDETGAGLPSRQQSLNVIAGH
jgi:hypothetical protein